MEEIETSNRLFEIVEDKTPFEPADKIRSGFDTGKWMQIETSSDDEDGTYPQVATYVKLCNAIDKDGASAWLNWRRKTEKEKLNPDLGYCTVIRDTTYTNEGTLLFKEPITVIFAYVNEEPVTRQVNKITGEFSYDFFNTRNGRQNKIANGFEIWFNCKKFELV